MSLIDQRILIVAPVEAVWTYVSDPALMSKWNKNCKQISVLSTRTTGVGTRRRCVGLNGRAVVEETTAWFENIGYEYHVVDGPYQDFRGRFRLQAIPDGTVVNWTVEYHLRGVLPGVRNFINFRRQFEDMMADSLRQLRKLVEASGVRLDPERHARFAMQDAPSVEARASWSPELTRPVAHAPHNALKAIAVGEDDLPELPIADIAPPTMVRTPPTPPEMTSPAAEPPFALSDTSAMQAVNGVDGEKHDTKPRPPVGLQGTIAAQLTSESDTAQETSDLERAATAPTVPISLVAPPPEPSVVQETQTVPLQATPPPRLDMPMTLPERVPMPLTRPPEPPKPDKLSKSLELTEPDKSLEDTDVRAPALKSIGVPGRSGDKRDTQPLEPLTAPPSSKRDSSEMSIWDVFGIERPSERVQAELEAAIASLKPENQPVSRAESAAPKFKFSAPGQSSPASARGKSNPKVRGLKAHQTRQKVSVRVRSINGRNHVPK